MMQVITPRPTRFLWAAILSIVMLLVAGIRTYIWYAVVRPCQVSVVEKVSTSLIRQRDRYDHSYQFATSASRDAIVRPVTELQQILMDTQEVVVPACMRSSKEELLSYMGMVIRAFDAYGAQESDSTVRDLLAQSEVHYENFASELEAVNKCAPFCFP